MRNRPIYSNYLLLEKSRTFYLSSWEPWKLRVNRTISSPETQEKLSYLFQLFITLEVSNYLFSSWESRKLSKLLNYQLILLETRFLKVEQIIELSINFTRDSLFVISVVKVLSGGHCAGEPRAFRPDKTSFKWSVLARKARCPVTRSFSQLPPAVLPADQRPTSCAASAKNRAHFPHLANRFQLWLFSGGIDGQASHSVWHVLYFDGDLLWEVTRSDALVSFGMTRFIWKQKEMPKRSEYKYLLLRQVSSKFSLFFCEFSQLSLTSVNLFAAALCCGFCTERFFCKLYVGCQPVLEAVLLVFEFSKFMLFIAGFSVLWQCSLLSSRIKDVHFEWRVLRIDAGHRWSFRFAGRGS